MLPWSLHANRRYLVVIFLHISGVGRAGGGVHSTGSCRHPDRDICGFANSPGYLAQTSSAGAPSLPEVRADRACAGPACSFLARQMVPATTLLLFTVPIGADFSGTRQTESRHSTCAIAQPQLMCWAHAQEVLIGVQIKNPNLTFSCGKRHVAKLLDLQLWMLSRSSPLPYPAAGEAMA